MARNANVRSTVALLALTAALAFGCSPRPKDAAKEDAKPAVAAAPAKPAAPSAPAEATVPPETYLSAIPPELAPVIDKAFTGDLDQMIQRRLIRVGVPYNRTFYFVDQGVQRGLSYEYLVMFEDQLNKKLKTGNLHVHVIALPMPRDQLIPQLRSGKIDLVVAQLTVTPEREALVAFSRPTRSKVNEVLVTGPGAPAGQGLEGLGEARVLVRKSSSYFSSLAAYNKRRAAEGKAGVQVQAAPENLEDDDLLEMVNAGLIPATVVDDYLAEYWKQVFPDLVIHSDTPLRRGGALAVAFRKNSPQLNDELNGFLEKNGLDSVVGRVLDARYLQSTKYVKGAASEAERRKFLKMVELFRKYGEEYSFDYLLMAAQGYQESRLDQDAKSHVGAVGVMQLMPATGREQKVGDIHELEPNIHAGVKYMRFMRDQYFKDEPMSDLNKSLFTFASYNAGAGRIRQLRRETAARGLDPNIWFGNVERIVSERIGRETVTYVGNIYKYYLAYSMVLDQNRRRSQARSAMDKPAR